MSVEVRDVMGRVAIAVELEADFAEIVAAMRRFKVGAVAVIDADRRPVGVVSEDDLLLREIVPRRTFASFGPGNRARRRKERAVRAVELMTSPAIVVMPGTSVKAAARLMHKHRVKQLPVIDPVTGRVCGTVHQFDLLRVFLRPAADLEADVTAAANPEAITCDVDRGVVTVAGEIGDLELRRLLREIREIDGVIDVAVGEITAPATVPEAVFPPLL
ncbi:CBS domain-containing protein [Herbidospora galbida]|uniref:CBS domain-containing protein n=1 Tax=Herbidospora galbida TaxID=2575442 RepID=A0A4U3M750_9ACTN|nr:CBS domain-containing protein [Herbidospora galbida]TKK84029.1 CBS domain-containing protein [Herbidospora galbida]